MVSAVSETSEAWQTSSRAVEAVVVPEGVTVTLPAGSEVRVRHRVGDDFSVETRGGYTYRIAGRDADAIGRETQAEREPPLLASAPILLSEDLIRDRLRTVYDPEIPINLVELGLIYAIDITDRDDGDHDVRVTMTLTAPGCGMSQFMVDDIMVKVQSLPGVASAEVDVVFDPPWDPSMMSEAARLEAGL